jgi:hypothetical protein
MQSLWRQVRLGDVEPGTTVVLQGRVVFVSDTGRRRLRLPDGSEIWAPEAGQEMCLPDDLRVLVAREAELGS